MICGILRDARKA